MDPKKKLRRVRFTRQFSAPREKVFALFASHERFGAALTGPAGEKLGVIRRVEASPDPLHPDGVGSTTCPAAPRWTTRSASSRASPAPARPSPWCCTP